MPGEMNTKYLKEVWDTELDLHSAALLCSL